MTLSGSSSWAAVVPAPAGGSGCWTCSAARVARRPRARGGGPLEASFGETAKLSSPRPPGWSARRLPAPLSRIVVPAPAGVVRRWTRSRSSGPTSSPRPRGWSGFHPVPPGRYRVVPAPAGVVPGSERCWCPGYGRPRARGGGPSARSLPVFGVRSSPRPRGWSIRGRHELHEQRVVPAPAGVVRRRTSPRRTCSSRPRARGGGPAAAAEQEAKAPSSPRPRGWSDLVPQRVAGQRVVPAPAGVVRCIPPRRQPCSSRPRARGGGPLTRHARRTYRPSSPRPRGWSGRVPVRAGPQPVIPAPAAVVRLLRAGRTHSTGRPRARGGGPVSESPVSMVTESSPRPRGWSDDVGLQERDLLVVPAPAGVVRQGKPLRLAAGGRPRARGGGPFWIVGVPLIELSSPRPRGWSAGDQAREDGERGRPRARAGVIAMSLISSQAVCRRPRARAGVIRSAPSSTGRTASRPRARGGGPVTGRDAVTYGTSSPRPRGWSASALLVARC